MYTKRKELPPRYECLAYYYVGTEKMAYRFRNVKTMAGVRSFWKESNYCSISNTQMKIEYTDKKTGITKQY